MTERRGLRVPTRSFWASHLLTRFELSDCDSVQPLLGQEESTPRSLPSVSEQAELACGELADITEKTQRSTRKYTPDWPICADFCIFNGEILWDYGRIWDERLRYATIALLSDVEVVQNSDRLTPKSLSHKSPHTFSLSPNHRSTKAFEKLRPRDSI